MKISFRLTIFMFAVCSCSSALAQDFFAKRFHKQYISDNEKKISVPLIKYIMLSKDLKPIKNLRIYRYLSFERLIGENRPDVQHTALNNVDVTDENGEVSYLPFRETLLFKSKPVIRLYLMKDDTSFSEVDCLRIGNSDHVDVVECVVADL